MFNSWSEGLPPELRPEFHKLTVADLMKDPMKLVTEQFCVRLSTDKQLELACATVLTAEKARQQRLTFRTVLNTWPHIARRVVGYLLGAGASGFR